MNVRMAACFVITGILAPTAAMFASCADAVERDESSSKVEAPRILALGIEVFKSESVGRDDSEASEDYWGLPQMQSPGTHLNLLITDPDRSFISLDHKASRIRQFRDDRGTDLMQAEKRGKEVASGWSPLSAIANADRHHCHVAVNGAGRPAQGAEKIHLQADVVLNCGQGRKAFEAKNVPLKNGAKISAGPLQFEVSDVSHQRFFGVEMVFYIRTEGNADLLDDVVVTDGEGNGIELDTLDHVPTVHFEKIVKTPAGKKFYNYVSFQLTKKVEDVNLKLIVFDTIEQVTIPVDLTAGIGL